MSNMDTKDEIATKFDQLILDLSRNRTPSFEKSVDELHQEVLDFVQDNVKISKILEELSQDAMFSKDLTKMTEYACADHFHSIARSTGTPVSLVASQILAQQLSDAVKKEDNQYAGHMLPHDVKQKVKVLLDIINKTKEKGTNSFDELIFVKNLPYKGIPMKLVWLLNESSVVSFRACFLSWCADEEWLEKFYESVASFCCDCGDIDLREKILQVFVGDLLLMSYGVTSERRKTAKEMQQILFKVIKRKLVTRGTLLWINFIKRNLVIWLRVDEANELIWKTRLCLYKIIRELRDVPSDIIQKFFQELLSDLLTAKPCSLKMEDAFACQDKWTFEFLSETTKAKYEQFVLVFRSDELVHIMQNAVESITSEAVDFKALCHLLTVFLVQNEEAYKLIDDFLQQCLSECLEICDTLQFRLVLLLRRQAALEGSHISPSYSTWFEKTFITKGSTLGLTTKKTIHFLFKSLTELVPCDRPEFLKVHIFKCPQVPSKFRYYMDDYVSLAKTRLQDLDIPLEDHSGLFGTQNLSNEENVKVMEQAQIDVEKCLSLYEQSGRIPTTIMEASIFRKPYFIGRFLPALLLPRNLSQEADTRAHLIEDLNRAGKIPAAMFRSYTRKCEQFDDFSKGDEPRDDIQKLTECLEKLPNLLVDLATGDDDTKDLQSWFSSVSRKLKSIFGSSGQHKAVDTIDLDIVALNIHKDCMQASYIIINIFCRACAAVQNGSTSETAPPSRRLSKFVWTSKFVSILISFPRLIQCLYVHLWSTVCHEPHVLGPEHINGLAILICHLSCFKSTSNIRSQSTTKPESELYQTFVDLISSRISLSSRAVCQFFLRWCCFYLQYAMVVFQNITTDLHQLSYDGRSGFAYVPVTMLIKMEYLYNKLKFRTAECESTMFLEKREVEILSLLIKSVNDAKLLSSSLSFKEWLTWELNIHDDFLIENERMQYYNWIIYEKFIPLTKTGKDEELVACREMATEIIFSLLDHWTSSQKLDTEKRRSTETNFVKILQDIVSLMGSNLSSQETRDNVWFLDCFISRLEKIGKDESPSSEIQTRCEIMAFLRLVTNLPPWLLVSNSEWERLTDDKTKKLSRFLNDHLKPCLFQGSRILPFNFTAHIFKILVKDLKPRDENLRQAQEEIFGNFLTNTPVIVASLVYYWGQLKPLYHGHLTSSKMLQHLQSYHSLLTSFLTTTERPSQHNIFPQDQVCDQVGLSYAIFVCVSKSVQDTSLEIKDFVDRLENLLDTLVKYRTGKKIVIHLYDSIMAYLASNVFQENEIKMHDEFWSDISTAILCRCPDVLCVFTQELNQNKELLGARAILFGRKVYRFLPVVFFRIFTLKEMDILQNKFPVEEFVQAVLAMYIQCTDLYQNCSDTALSKQPLDLDSFVKITVFVKGYLNFVPSAVVQRMPELLVTKLPKEIKRYFSR